MAWQERILNVLGPPLLSGIRLGDWLKLLRENDFAVHPRYFPRLMVITQCAFVNSVLSAVESVRFGKAVATQKVSPPLFIIGHWRSGTTHLQNLIAVDQRFAFPTLYQVLFPTTFLTTEAFVPKLVQPLLPERRATDNVPFTLDVPYEDEFALCNMVGVSSYLKMIFPRNERYYERFLSMQEATEAERKRWQGALVTFIRKLELRSGRPVVLKSPTHTARIGLLLQLFPGAKFVHIHRHPYDVFQSTRRVVGDSDRKQRLQDRHTDLDELVMRQYNDLYDSYFEEVALIPSGHFHEIRFDDLERDPVGSLREMYSRLDLPDFDAVESEMRRYAGSVSGYKKNAASTLPEPLRDRIRREWGRSFEQWGYE